MASVWRHIQYVTIDNVKIFIRILYEHILIDLKKVITSVC